MSEDPKKDENKAPEGKDNSAEKGGLQAVLGLYNKITNYSLKNDITKVRDRINEPLASLPEIAIPHYDETRLDVVKRPLYEASEYCQKNYPYLATISRSHHNHIVAVTTLAVAISSRSNYHHFLTI